MLILGGVVYWRISQTATNVASPQTPTVGEAPIEVPKTLPGATLEDRVKSLETSFANLINQFNSLKSNQATSAFDSRLKDVEGAVTELKLRVSTLEKSTPAQVSSAQSAVYIPLGSGGGPWGNQGWYSLAEYQISLNPSNYPGYTAMYLEVTFRLTEKSGTGSVRLYNSTVNSAISSQVDTTSDSFTLQTSSSFKLATGTKTYQLQIQSTNGAPIQIQNARIRVNF